MFLQVTVDRYFHNQTPQTFKDVCNVKVVGITNLDKLTREKCQKELDWFIAFSSTAAGLGNVGQANYAFANAFMERVIQKRQEDGVNGKYQYKEQPEFILPFCGPPIIIPKMLQSGYEIIYFSRQPDEIIFLQAHNDYFS